MLDEVYISARYPGDLGLLPSGKPTVEDTMMFFDFADTVYKGIIEILKKNEKG